VDSKDYYGQTPLSWAAAAGHEAVVKLLHGFKLALTSDREYLPPVLPF
jgi:ankyrin repeat protein